MKIRELKDKTKEELRDMLQKKREDLRLIRFKIATKETQKVRESRSVRKTIAQVLTLLRQYERGKKV